MTREIPTTRRNKYLKITFVKTGTGQVKQIMTLFIKTFFDNPFKIVYDPEVLTITVTLMTLRNLLPGRH